MSRISAIKASISATISSAAIFVLTVPVYAIAKPDPLGALKKAGEAGGFNAEQSDPALIAGKIIGGFLALVGSVFVILMIYAGFLWMTAQGNEEQVTKAKNLIKNAVIGIAVVFIAYAVTYFVINALMGATGTAPEGTTQ